MNEHYKKFVLANHQLNRMSITEFAKKELQLKLWDKQIKILEDFYESGKLELLLVCGKKSSKTTMAAIIACYEVYCLLRLGNPHKHFNILEGQPIYVLNTCTGKKQAQNIFLNYVKSMVSKSRFLTLFLSDVFTADEIRFDYNIRVMSQSSNSISSLGYTCICTMFDELAWFRDTSGNFSGKAVYDSLKPNLKPFGKAGKSIVFSSPGPKSGVFYKIYLDSSAYDSTFMIQLPTWEINPTISRESLDEEFRKDPLKARMDWGAEFVDISGTALNSTKIDEAVAHDNMDIYNFTDKVNEYVLALDPGLKHDAYAISFGHKESEVPVIDFNSAWQGTTTEPVDIEEVENFIRMVCARLNVVLIVLDQHQSASTIQKFRKEGYNIKETYFSAPYNVAIYTNLIEKLNTNKIKLPNVQELIMEMKALKRVGAGKYAKYEAPTSGAVTHDDRVDATANCTYQLEILYKEVEDMGTDDFGCDGKVYDEEDGDKDKEQSNVVKKDKKQGTDKSKKEEEVDEFAAF